MLHSCRCNGEVIVIPNSVPILGHIIETASRMLRGRNAFGFLTIYSVAKFLLVVSVSVEQQDIDLVADTVICRCS